MYITRRRRVNYKYLIRLGERLQDLGHDIHELPQDMLLNELWPAHRAYLETELGLAYCVRCKLPCANEDMDPKFTNICLEHGDILRGFNEARTEAKFARRMERIEARAAGIVKLSEDHPKEVSERIMQLFRSKEASQHGGNVGASNLETTRKPPTHDTIGEDILAVLNRSKA